jgi:Flp pilus assembly protein TadG
MKTKSSLNKQKGQSLVELSVLLTFLIVMLAGVADFGRAYLAFVELRDAAQEGASYGSHSPSDFTEIEARVRDTMQDPLDLSDPSVVTIVPSLTNPLQACAGFDPGTLEPNEIEVTVLYQMPIAMPFLGTIIGSQELALEATVTNTILQPPCS